MVNLTKRERQVISLIAQGKSNKEIGKELFISVHTVKANLENIYEKLQIHSRVLLAIYAYKNDLL